VAAERSAIPAVADSLETRVEAEPLETQAVADWSEHREAAAQPLRPATAAANRPRVASVKSITAATSVVKTKARVSRVVPQRRSGPARVPEEVAEVRDKARQRPLDRRRVRAAAVVLAKAIPDRRLRDQLDSAAARSRVAAAPWDHRVVPARARHPQAVPVDSKAAELEWPADREPCLADPAHSRVDLGWQVAPARCPAVPVECPAVPADRAQAAAPAPLVRCPRKVRVDAVAE
jgi:hypothetical protein